MKKINTVQNWLPYEEIFDNGIIKLNGEKYIKILKIKPINFNLKSELEKEAILNSYKIFLKTCNFNFQILIQSNKEDINKIINKINNNLANQNNSIQKLSKKYIKYIQDFNSNKKSSTKKFYIIIKYDIENKNNINIKEYAESVLTERYFKIKECLSRCGNDVESINNKKEIISFLFSFLNSRVYFNERLGGEI